METTIRQLKIINNAIDDMINVINRMRPIMIVCVPKEGIPWPARSDKILLIRI